MFLFVLIFTGFFYIIGRYFESSLSYLVLGLIISVASSITSYYYSDKIVLFTTGAKPAQKEDYFDFYTTTENLAMAAGLPMPKLYVLEDPSLNAFATGRDPNHAVVCATTGLLRNLDRSEIEAVISHELSHIKNYDILLSSLIAVLVGTLALVSDWVFRSFWWRDRNDDDGGRSPVAFFMFIIVLLITPIVATLIQLSISRKRELLADASGSLITRNPAALISALKKISLYPGIKTASTSTAHLFIANPFLDKRLSNWLSNLFSTHPPIDERIRLLRSM
ncbi:M48 family metallopeptidase [Patescibacteria group bacterium]|nr:M48 family metallopeptidase [Patescibacteria group bacterium]